MRLSKVIGDAHGLALFAASLVCSCGGSESKLNDTPPSASAGSASGASASGASASGGSTSGASASGGGSAGSLSVSTPRPVPPDVKPYPGDGQACEPGAPYACDCADGSTGTTVCIAGSGEYTACGCTGAADYPGETCGANPCPYLTVDGVEFTAAHCCTADNQCGMKNSSVFNDTCYPRYAEHYGERNETCDQPIAFVETRGCCRPDNQCGLVLVTGSNWDELGCVEALDLAERMKQSFTLSLFLIGTGNGDALSKIQARSCQYEGGNDGSYKPERYQEP